MCGTVSFKRGESYYRINKVSFHQYEADFCEASVKGTEEFHIRIEKSGNDDLHTNCSCPKLASYDKDCQHIAAVLFGIYEHQRQGTSPIQPTSTEQTLTDGLMNLFKEDPVRSSGHQRHFETRKILEVAFTCVPLSIGKEENWLGIKMKIGPANVHHIKDFLWEVREGASYVLSDSFRYDPRLHCFAKEADDVIQQLVQVSQDEKIFLNAISDKKHLLLIPPSSWIRLLPLLVKAPTVEVENNGRIYNGFRFSTEKLPLQFHFTETKGNGYHLLVSGDTDMVMLEAYDAVLYQGEFIQLESKDCKRLLELNKMVNVSGKNTIPIQKDQMGFFLEKVVPGLKTIGTVHIPQEMGNHTVKTPLIAKLYLDRVKNRLLAGLEFHYGSNVNNPLENRDFPTGAMVIRDVEKEDEILQLMEESSFAKTESGYLLHNEDLEYEFLYYMIPKLKKYVQIYATTAVRNRVFRKSALPRIRVKVHKERTNWLEFKFEMDGIPERQIREILQALEEKRKYYRLQNGSLLSLESREFEEIHHFLHSPQLENKDLVQGFVFTYESKSSINWSCRGQQFI